MKRDWHFYHVTHHQHEFWNPISSEGVDELAGELNLQPGTRVLDIACGFGEMLARWSRSFEVVGVGVDLSPFAIEKARSKKVPGVEFLEMNGADYRSDERFDVAMCIGASWIWNGFAGTLTALKGFADTIVSGEPFWIEDPPEECLSAMGLKRDDIHSFEGCRDVARSLGLREKWCRVSTSEEWDHYELDQMKAVDAWPEPVPEIRELRQHDDEVYLRWGKPYMGYATWIFE